MKFFLIMIITCCSINVWAQYNPMQETLSWKATQFFNADNQETVSHESEFLTVPGGAVKWLQNNGDTVYEFNVLNISGMLTDSSGLIYTVTLNNATGTLRFKESSSGAITIEMEFMKEGSNSMPYTFTVSQVLQK